LILLVRVTVVVVVVVMVGSLEIKWRCNRRKRLLTRC
jgi:hypothetical protein